MTEDMVDGEMEMELEVETELEIKKLIVALMVDINTCGRNDVHHLHSGKTQAQNDTTFDDATATAHFREHVRCDGD